MRRDRGWIPGLVIMALMLVAVPSAQASVEEDAWEIEVYVGTYEPDVSFVDDDTTFGIRFGSNITERFNFGVSVGIVDSEESFTNVGSPPASGDVNYDAILLDVTFGVQFWTESPVTGIVYGGFGWGDVDLDVDAVIEDDVIRISGAAKDSFLINLGLGAKIDLGDRFYLRIDGKARRFDDRSDDELDLEYTVGLGIKFDAA